MKQFIARFYIGRKTDEVVKTHFLRLHHTSKDKQCLVFTNLTFLEVV